MSTVAEAVHRGSDGSVHYLSSNPKASFLLITDPVVGVSRIPVDGLCRLIKADGDSVEYQSIGARSSTTVRTSPGQEPLISEYGFCFSCVGGPHDYDLWPVCRSGDRGKKVDGNSVSTPPEVATRDAASLRPFTGAWLCV
jgi:hypothetical protein